MQEIRRLGVPIVSSDARPLVAGFLGLQFFLGYEWLMSGLSKLLAGNFASGLGATLDDMTMDQTGWYRDFVSGTVIPNSQLFGTLVLAGELALGMVLVGAALSSLVWWSRMSGNERRILLGAVAVSSVIGAFMSVNFHLAMGANPPWLISPDPNDQGVDLDSLMVAMQLVLGAASVAYFRSARRHAG